MNMVCEHRHLMHMDCRPVGRGPNYLDNVARIDSADASRTQPGVPRDV